MKKRTRNIIIIGAAALVLIILYFAVINPWVSKVLSEEEDVPELLDGEVLGSGNRILLFEHTEKADMLSIEVHNQFGSYKFYRGDDDNFYIEGMEMAPYSLEMLSSLVVSTGYTLSMKRLDFEEMEDDFSVYGLGENDNPAWYVVTKMDGRTHKVIVGNMIPTGGGYYCMYEGRKAVYILDTSFTTTVLADIHTFLTPTLGWPVSTSSYYFVDDFQIIRNGELYVWIDNVPAAEDSETGLPTYELKIPEGYTCNLTTYSAILEKLTSFAGESVVAAGVELKDADETYLKNEFGIDLDNPYFLLHYKVDEIDTMVIFSEPDDDGMVYAYSTVYNLVAKMSASSAEFLKWGLLEYVDPGLFGKNINDVAKMEIKGSIESEGITVDEYFTLDGEGETIIIRQNGESTAYDADSVKNFRQLYKVFLGIKLQDYVDEGYEKNLKELCEAKVTMDDGTVLEYKFWSYSTRRCYYTINGVGEFYCFRDSVEKLIRDTYRMVNGQQIISDDKS